MQKIEKGTDNGLFDWILESETHGTWPENNSAMIRVLVQKHNEMVDAFKELKSDQKKALNESWNDGYIRAMEEVEEDRIRNSQ